VSHELRTPLTSVLGFAKIIKKRLEDRIFPSSPPPTRRSARRSIRSGENLKVVVSEGERLTKLIDDVLDLAKIEAGKLEWHMDTVAMADVIDRATAATSSLFHQKGLTLVRDVPGDLPAVVGDADRLLQVVINLISNAVKFTAAGTVTCRARVQDDGIAVSVIDTGWASPRRTSRRCSRSSSRSATRSPTSQGHWPRPPDLPRDRRAPRRAHLGGERAGQGQHVHLRAAGHPRGEAGQGRRDPGDPRPAAPRAGRGQRRRRPPTVSPTCSQWTTIPTSARCSCRSSRRRATGCGWPPTAARPWRKCGGNGPTWSSST